MQRKRRSSMQRSKRKKWRKKKRRGRVKGNGNKEEGFRG